MTAGQEAGGSDRPSPQPVTICGPNLNHGAQKKGQFHVHAADCGDLRHYGEGTRHGGERPWTVEASTRREVVEAMYGPTEFDWDPDDPEQLSMYAGDFHFAPCVHLPQR